MAAACCRAANGSGPRRRRTTVRVREGEVLTSDGPFAETKEQLAGFYLVDCKDLDEAIEVASKIPGATHGSVEVRPDLGDVVEPWPATR